MNWRRALPRGKRLTVVAALLAVCLLSLGQFGCRQYWEDQRIYAGWQVQTHGPTGFCRLLDREGELRASGRGETCAAALEQARLSEELHPESRHLVVMLHGLGRTPFIFRRMEKALEAAGYEAVAISYPSLTKDVGHHAAHLERLLDGLQDVEQVSFVTHSLGGLVLRETLARDGDWRDRLDLGRAVMLAPPSRGSELARALNAVGPFHFFGGPSAGQLGEGESFAAPPPALEFGVIAGGTAGGRGFNPFLSANNDGIVTVAETRLGGASDFLVVPVIHTVIASAPETIAATLSFLAKGSFSQSLSPSSSWAAPCFQALGLGWRCAAMLAHRKQRQTTSRELENTALRVALGGAIAASRALDDAHGIAHAPAPSTRTSQGDAVHEELGDRLLTIAQGRGVNPAPR